MKKKKYQIQLKRVLRYYFTIRGLKFTQVYHQIKYRLVKPKRLPALWDGVFIQVNILEFPNKQNSLLFGKGMWSFSFLNLKQSFFRNSIVWSFGDHGLLWTYNLNYFDWLHQFSISKEQGIETLSLFYATPTENNPIILHPYPTSLRIINVAKFISKWDIKEDWLYNELVSDLKFLSGRLEYHLLANHLLENAFALYIGGLMMNQGEFTQKGKKLLVRELKEQVLNDGMHYERSPMYHLIILERLLDALNFAKATGDDLESTLKSYAIRMTGLAMNWEELDSIPMMQDSAYDIALPVSSIIEYGKDLLGNDFPRSLTGFQDSGYRKIDSGNLSAFVNLGQINPGYQPAHSHADELNFELFFKGYPLIVDTGVNTYEKNKDRLFQRSTLAHNCVTINDRNSSDVWSSFRVGKRATVNLLEENNRSVLAERIELNSIERIKRRISLVSNEFILEDSVAGLFEKEAKGRLHFHPNFHVNIINEQEIFIKSKSGYKFLIESENINSWHLDDFHYSYGFNCSKKSKVLIYYFTKPIQIKLKVI